MIVGRCSVSARYFASLSRCFVSARVASPMSRVITTAPVGPPAASGMGATVSETASSPPSLCRCTALGRSYRSPSCAATAGRIDSSPFSSGESSEMGWPTASAAS